MINVAKIDVYGNVLEKGIIVHGLYINSYASGPKVVLPIKNNYYVIAIDNDQSIYIVDSITTSGGKIQYVAGSSVYYYNDYTDRDKIRCIGDTYFYYHNDYSDRGKLYKIGESSIYYENNNYYEAKGKVRIIDDTHIFYWPQGDDVGKVKCIGDTYIYYYPSYSSEKGNVKCIGDVYAYYDYYGRLTSVGDYRF